ncbi:MAG: undecaprenyl-diphosphate phosphatase, partial [Francisellaceae bacterium]|nr:undecaprenyl-diphosphate phosphatase [Francisellaceae bacterium]
MTLEPMQAVILSFIQGVTEFLPVSSSAHLIIFPKLFGWQDQGLVFDVAVHFGTLLAVLLYFKDTVTAMLRYLFRFGTKTNRLAWSIVIATIPVGACGLLVKMLLSESSFRSIDVICFSTILFGILLWFASSKEREKKLAISEYEISLKAIILIGIAQAFALIPGASRSGVTLTAGLLLGMRREAAARFSFLLSIPVICLAFFLEIYEITTKNIDFDLNTILIGVISSFIFAYFSIKVFMKMLTKFGLVPFVLYRLVLGVFL